MRFRPVVAFAAVLLSSALPIRAADSPSPLASALDRAARDLPQGGFAAAEVSAGGVTYRAAGRIGGPEGVPPEKLIFEIGSITKWFTGLLLAQATLDGKVALDDPIARHLPADLRLDPSVAGITLVQLATHTSGLPRLPDNLRPAMPADPYADYTVERLYAYLRSAKVSGNAPHAVDYSNLGVGLLGHILARVYGVSYAELVRQKISGPLGLTDTVLTLEAEQRGRFVPAHSGTQKVLPWEFDALAGAGALRSTATDLAKFAQALCDDNSPIAPAWRLAREKRASGSLGDVGLGVFSRTTPAGSVYSHGGGTGGYRSHLEVSPATRTATVVLLNNDSPEPGNLVAASQRGNAPTAGAKAAPADTPTEVPIAAAELAAFTGTYSIDARGKFSVVVDEQGRLRIRLTGQAFLPVAYMGGDRFFAKAVAAQFQFARDAAGKVSAVTLHQNGREVPATRTGDAPQVVFLPVEKLREYAGVYELAPGLVFEITARPLTLVAKLTGQPAIPVHCTQPDRFVYDVVEAALTFERDAEGKVVAVVLHQNGMDQRAPRQAAKP
jgi:CubicO group peptidase (beta-lactamase class C family)